MANSNSNLIPDSTGPNASYGLVELSDGDETRGLTTEDPAHLGAPSKPKRYALPRHWEQHKDIIRQLYLEENKTLKVVRNIMEQDHKHFGT